MNAPALSTDQSPGDLWPRIIGLAVAIVGGLVLAGWALDLPALTTVLPGAVTMKPNAALGFLLSGGALFLLQMPGSWARRMALVGAVMAGGLGFVTLVESAVGANFGIDELFFRDPNPTGGWHPGRMAPNAATGFVLTAAALWLMGRSGGKVRRPMLLAWLGALVLGIGFVAVLGYLAAFSTGYRWWARTGIALHAAALFTVLGVAVLRTAWRQAGLRWVISRRLTAGFAGGLLLLIAVAANAHRSTKEMVQAGALVKRTHDIILKIGELEADLEAEENGMHGFVITGDESFVALSDQAVPEAQQNLRELRKLTKDQAGLAARFAELEPAVAGRMDFSQEMIALRRARGLAAATERIAAGRGRELSARCRAGLRAMVEEAEAEERLIAAREARAGAVSERTFAILPAGVLLGTLLLAVGLLKLNREAAARQRGAELLTRERSALEEANEALAAENAGRKRVEEELRAASQTLQLFFEQTPMAVIEWDLDFRVTRWNPAARTIFGYRREEAVGQHASFIVPEAFRRHVDTIWQNLLKQSGGERSSNENVRKDGRTIVCEWYNTPLIDEHGAFTGAASVVMDITERKLAEEEIRQLNTSLEQRVAERTGELQAANAALHESEERVRLATEAAEIGVWAWDLKTDELKWDARMFALYGLPAHPEGRAVYADWQARVPPEDLAAQEARLQQTVATCGRSHREFRIVRADDQTVRYIQAAEMVVVGSDGKAARLVGINRDITQRKLAETQINQLNADLQSRAAELETANKELEGFSYSVSHDLRAPLRAVDGFARMLTEDCAERLDDDGRRMLGVIRSESQRMARLIDDLLAFSRLGRQTLEPQEIDMHGLARGVFDELAALETGRELRLALAPLPPARGSEAMLRQVWANLISNAIKFTSGCAIAEIEIGTRDDADGGVVYFVKDNGAGFDMRYADKLFGVFQRLHTQDEFTGTGVGLALVQRIVSRHGGRIWAEGEISRGATFFFTIPKRQP